MLIALCLSLVANVGLALFAIRISKRILEFDVAWDVVQGRVEEYIDFLNQFVDRPVLSNSSEVRAFSDGMRGIRDDLQTTILSIGGKKEE